MKANGKQLVSCRAVLLQCERTPNASERTRQARVAHA